MRRLLFVSNRLPVTVRWAKNGLEYERSAGGLSNALSSFYKKYESIWFGWPGADINIAEEEEQKKIRKKLIREYRAYPVRLSSSDINMYYCGFSNKTIWPLFHYFAHLAEYNNEYWEAYKRVNRIFCDEISKRVAPDDTVWIHDYHLMLLPEMLKKDFSDIKIGFFLHIPFPSFEIFRLLPWRKEVLSGLLGSDLIGFHTYDYVRHFLSSVRRLLGYDTALGQISAPGKIVKADVFPLGIEYRKFSKALRSSKVQKEIRRQSGTAAGKKIILSVDRLDYTKGIYQRLEAFEYFLNKYPGFKGRVTLIVVAVPSRINVDSYRKLKNEIDELIGRINGRHGTFDWMPVWYRFDSLPFHELAALYNMADVALVTPVRDGMNLIAKEFVASKADRRGVLVLSEMAGAAQELGEALIVNPNNREEVAANIKKALEMDSGTQIQRNEKMQERLQTYDVIRWAHDFIARLENFNEKQKKFIAGKLTAIQQKQLISDYCAASGRLLLLDCDGTLWEVSENTQRAGPCRELLKSIAAISYDGKNDVCILSGRDKKTIEKWFGEINNLILSAENGAWIREKNNKWQLTEPLITDWKYEIIPIIKLFVDRTPGSYFEEKEYSLVWDYKKVDSELAALRLGELNEDLLSITSNLDIGIVEGGHFIEVKNTGINKGKIALRFLNQREYDFILAMGDDVTDEKTFSILPQNAYSVKVGLHPFPSRAKFKVDSPKEARSLINKLEVNVCAL